MQITVGKLADKRKIRSRICIVVGRCLSLGAVLLWTCLFSTVVVAQTNTLSQQAQRLSSNNTFEVDIAQWHVEQTKADWLTRDWTVSFNTNYPGEDNGALGTQLVRLRGAGRLEQFFTIAPNSHHHLLNLQAFRRASAGDGDGGKAFACVTYYDSDWSQLDCIAIPIDGRDANKNRGFGDGMNFSSWGLFVPNDAVNVHLYIQNFADTEVYLDDFGLFDYSFHTKPPVSPNLIANPRFSRNLFARIDGGIDSGSLVRGYGTEFWENEIDWSETFAPLLLAEFGSRVQPEYAYQFVPVEAEKTYTLTVVGNGPLSSAPGTKATTPASFGLDFYDAKWNHLGKVLTDVTGRGGEMSMRVAVPSGTTWASVWLWCDTLRGNDSPFLIYGGYYLQKHDERVSNDTSIMASDLTFRQGVSGTTVGGGVVVAYSDIDGIDESSIDSEDAYFVSKSDPKIFYPATVYSRRFDDQGRLAFVEYLAGSANFRDAGSLAIRANQVKDKKGNYASPTVFGGLNLYPY